MLDRLSFALIDLIDLQFDSPRQKGNKEYLKFAVL